MSDDPIDLSYRPASYFWPISHKTHLIASIKGERRRQLIQTAHDAGQVTRLDEHYSAPALSESDRRALGRLHPSFMGGEYLPDREETEIEIARIVLASTTRDVTSVYAKAGADRLHYRVVDEYNGDTLRTACERSSIRPLTLGELVEVFFRAWPLRDLLESLELDRARARAFVDASSAFYPEFGALIAQEIDGWYDEIEGDADDEDEEEEYPDDLPDPSQDEHDRWLASQSREDIRKLASNLKALMERKDREAATGSSDEPPV